MIEHRVVVTLNVADDFQPPESSNLVQVAVGKAIDELHQRQAGRFRAQLVDVRVEED